MNSSSCLRSVLDFFSIALGVFRYCSYAVESFSGLPLFPVPFPCSYLSQSTQYPLRNNCRCGTYEWRELIIDLRKRVHELSRQNPTNRNRGIDEMLRLPQHFHFSLKRKNSSDAVESWQKLQQSHLVAVWKVHQFTPENSQFYSERILNNHSSKVYGR